jgi:hypothetical protein
VSDSLALTETLTQLELMLGQPVSITLGSDEVGTYPLFLINGQLRRSGDAGVSSFEIVTGGDSSSRLVLSDRLFKRAKWDERDQALRIETTAGLLTITTRLVAGISRRR